MTLGVSSSAFLQLHSKSVSSQPTPVTPLATHWSEQDGRSVMVCAAAKAAMAASVKVYFILIALGKLKRMYVASEVVWTTNEPRK